MCALSYIVFLHQTTTARWHPSHPLYCLISSFYIKPQQRHIGVVNILHCLISSFYIKPQLECEPELRLGHCLISSFYIKPQLGRGGFLCPLIVLYRLSTSNHNCIMLHYDLEDIVLYRLSTSNHNFMYASGDTYIIVLYRLSTSNHNRFAQRRTLHLIVLYRLSTSNHNFLYGDAQRLNIVLYRLSTSNHNLLLFGVDVQQLSYIVFLHQTTTVACDRHRPNNCLISSFYIKPQLRCCCNLCTPDCLISSFYIKPQHYLYIHLIINQFYHI